MKFTIFQDSRIGKRKSNQDRLAYSYSRDALMMVVADGMGGHLHGEIAAQIAAQYITETFQREAKPTLTDPFLFLSRTLTNAHHAIIDYSVEQGLAEAPRTTCVCCVVQDSVAYWAHAGDSRLYLLRGNRILTMTHDHTRVQSLVDQGLISAEDALHHPSRNRVYSCLGGTQSPQIDFSRKTPLKAGDTFLLCTDGVWGPLGDDLIVRGLTGVNLIQAVPRLMQHAEERGGETADNLSAIAMTWEDNYDDGDTTLGVETQTMPLGAHTTTMEEFGRHRPPQPDLTDDDIEKAIDEIRNAIEKYK
ncbi:MAG: serine/threonine-protein phosphatase [Rhodocyclaceae bacterium]|nr:serine/threonine-protein phosphatase [Rhodocyclaceae bacterium]